MTTDSNNSLNGKKAEFDTFFATIKDRPTYLILGAQGSGTNLLARILGSALDFSVTIDRSLIFNAAANLCHKQTKEQAVIEANRIVESLFPGPIQKRLLPRRYYVQNKNYEGIRDHLHHAHTSSPSEFANFFYCYHAFVTEKSHKGMKSDDIWENLDLLEEIIPNYRILLLVRDPRDNAISIMNKNFGPCEIYHASKFVRHRIDAYLAAADRHPDRAHCVKYEELLSDPIDCVKKMESFVEAEVTPDAEERIDRLNIKQDNRQKWKKLSANDLASSESVFFDILQRFDYEPGTNCQWNPSSLERLRLGAKDKLLRVPQKLAVKARRYVRG